MDMAPRRKIETKRDTETEGGNFWKKLPKPFFCSAPMANVTDATFRALLAKYGKPDVMYTEFVSAEGLCSEGKEKLLSILEYSKIERPIVAQIFGSHPDKIFHAAEIILKLGFDGLDINMGCPDKSVVKQGSGSALIKNPELAQEIIKAAREGARKLPVSIKTRIGFDKSVLETWLPILLCQKPAAVTIHARTKKQMSLAPADWESVAEAVSIRNKMKSGTLIIGNGDVVDLGDGFQRVRKSGADGFMVGRALLGNPWFGNNLDGIRKAGVADIQNEIPVSKRLKILIEHARLYERVHKKERNFLRIRRHLKHYTKGLQNARAFREKILQAKNADEVERTVEEYDEYKG